jgi:hypothetical protein
MSGGTARIDGEPIHGGPQPRTTREDSAGKDFEKLLKAEPRPEELGNGFLVWRDSGVLYVRGTRAEDTVTITAFDENTVLLTTQGLRGGEVSLKVHPSNTRSIQTELMAGDKVVIRGDVPFSVVGLFDPNDGAYKFTYAGPPLRKDRVDAGPGVTVREGKEGKDKTITIARPLEPPLKPPR